MSLSPMEVRILSELRRCRGSTSPTDLARRAGLSRPVLYVLLRRLAKRRWVTRTHGRRPGHNQTSVFYSINAAGRKAREAFARKVGLKP